MKYHGLVRRLTGLLTAACTIACIANVQANPVSEFGTLTKNQSNSAQWHNVAFDETYATPPVVVMGPLTTAGGNPSTVRVRNVTTSGFEWQIDEYDYLDGSHTAETVSYFVLEEGVHDIGGLIFEAGRTNVSSGFKTVSLAGSHVVAPVVLSQVETAVNMLDATDTKALITRARNVSTTSFQVQLQDEELATTAILNESVGYIAATPGQGYLNGRPFEILLTGDVVTGGNTTVNFGGLLRNPGILGNQQTRDGGDVARLRYRSATDTSAVIWLEEELSKDDEIGHTSENVGLMIVGDAYGEADSKLQLLTINMSDDWETVDLSQTYSNPVVVLGPPSMNGGDKSTVRVRNVTATSFEAQVDEWDYRDGGHNVESVSVLVMEAGVFEMGGLKWQAGEVGGATHVAAAESFIDPFTATPIVLGQIVTTNEPEALTHRFSGIDGDGFAVELDEEKGNDGTHGPETVHYVAIESGQGSFTSIGGMNFTVGSTNTVSHIDEVVSFGANYALPVFLADFQSYNEADPVTIRSRKLTAGSATIFAEEEESLPGGNDHADEVVGYLTAATVLDSDGDGMGDDWETQNGLNPADPNDAGNDPDNDLLTHLEEFEAGYDPFVFSGGSVSLATLDKDSFEKEGTRARFRINRKVGKASLDVNFTIDGSTDLDAVSSPSDYNVTLNNGTILNGAVTIPENAASIIIYVDPIDDGIFEYPENFRITLQTDPDYILTGSAKTGTISDATDDPDNDKLYVGLYTAEPWAAGQTSASGFSTLVMNGSNTQAVVSSSFSGLTTGQNASHIHHADESSPNGLPGPTVISLPHGQVTGEVWDIVPSEPYSGQDLIDSLNKQNGFFLYANVHTEQFQSGEIRAVYSLVDGGTYEEPAVPPAITSLSGDDLTRDVSRFLTQATFGPTQAEIEGLVDDINNNHGGDRIAGFAQWIDDQFALDQTNLYDYTYAADQQEWALRGSDPINFDNSNDPDHNNRRRGWWPIAVKAHDQLRQRTGFALSEIFVISEAENNVRVRHYGAAKYYDNLVAAADGNFRSLIEDISKSPVMGAYLSSLKNQKALSDGNGNILVAPDENYAREIMQLFSVGLLQLNPDGTLELDEGGLPIQTYTNEDITELARVFTGWSFSKGHGNKADGYPVVDNTNFNRGNGPKYFQASWTNPMKNFADKHDTGEKNFLGGTVSAGLSGEACLDAALDIIHNHQNTGPFLARLMIQRLTHSNPSRGYVYRVAQAYESGTYNGSGSGQRGDFGAMVRAILLDYEARTLSLADDIGYGKQKEPIVRYTQILRAFDANSQLPLSDLSAYGYPAGQLDNFPPGMTRFRYGDTTTVLSQSPLRPPTVFNWFLPDYEPGGAASAAGLVAPEMIQTTETQVIYNLNYLNQISRGTWQGVNALVGQTDPDLDNVAIDKASVQAFYDAEISGGATVAEAVTTLVDHLDVLLMAGNFKATYGNAPTPNPRSIAIDLIASQSNGSKVKDAIYLLATTPEYIHQK
ncbi:MAG: DUF1800 family protein [Verrucomicrobiales bacterium]|nr:DUF1800 family protein [Verrucomicrobiales bacterium]